LTCLFIYKGLSKKAAPFQFNGRNSKKKDAISIKRSSSSSTSSVGLTGQLGVIAGEEMYPLTSETFLSLKI